MWMKGADVKDTETELDHSLGFKLDGSFSPQCLDVINLVTDAGSAVAASKPSYPRDPTP